MKRHLENRIEQFLLACAAWCVLSCAPPAPQRAIQVSRIYPSCGPERKITPLVVEGSGFSAGDLVLFGKAPAARVRVLSSHSIQAVAPPSAAGNVSITVIGAGSRRTVPSGYHYVSPATFDPNGDCHVDTADIIYLAAYIRHHGPAPILSGDANGDGVLDERDIDWLVAYLFSEGPPPVRRSNPAIAQLNRLR